MQDRWLNVKEVAGLLGISVPSVYKLVREKKIPHYRLPKNTIRFKEKEILNWLKKRRAKEQRNK